ncbi:hypothetical protein GGH12_003568 [Coemansia sp. RSA 1822]|nr:hypothetical protein LPJ76_000348 [Coemansia sp. RSA 638]KAJ2125079.1 hypothetical protein IW147_001210 [Coemansia sp. RSA 720]KAJ2561942.1 hypothetical protein GGH12_003568 [Coemansia sp. RSA 1822]
MSASPKITESPAEKVDLPNKVFVGNLPFKTTDEELREQFEKVGPVAEARVIRRGKRSLGYGFVAFVSASSVDECVSGTKVELDGRTINVEAARPMSETEKAPTKRRPRRARKAKEESVEAKSEAKPEAKPEARKPRVRAKKPEDGPASETVAYVGNLPFATTDDELSALFAGFSISSARIVTNKKSSRSKGYGFVTFASHGDQTNAIAKFSAEPLVVADRPLNIKAALSESPVSDSADVETS